MISFYTSRELLNPELFRKRASNRVAEKLEKISDETWLEMAAVSQVFPFKVNQYVVEELIEWSNFPNDPIFRLTFPQGNMLAAEDLASLVKLLKQNASQKDIKNAVNSIRKRLNPHPAGQARYNIPQLDGLPVSGIQHKYPETVLLFPSSGQTCHSYCQFCFRWPQFVGMEDVYKFSVRESGYFQDYLYRHKEVTDVLITGGDPLTMKARRLAAYIEPLLSDPRFDHIQTIRIGTKSAAYWPYRFVSDSDSDDILRLFEKVSLAGKHLALMCHYVHGKEHSTDISKRAIERIRSTGAQIRTQGPLMRGINDSPEVWAGMWKEQIRLGCIPYYLFMERDTGAKHYFEVPILKAWEIFQKSLQQLSGLARTVRGPVMSTLPGKILVDGVANLRDEKVFVLSFIQGRDPNWCKRPFFARYDAKATWLTDLRPAFESDAFFYENQLSDMLQEKHKKV